MATALQCLRLTARTCRCKLSIPQYATHSIEKSRVFSTTTLRWSEQPTSTLPPKIQKLLEDSAEGRKFLSLDKKLESALAVDEEAVEVEFEEEFRDEMAAMNITPPSLPFHRKKLKETLMNMGEEESWEEDGMLDDDHDDITSLGHGELEHHREMRHYARLAAWEMPLLSKLAKPFVPPTADMPLRFRYTTYMGEKHPAEKKVVLEFCTEDMPNLTPIQREKLKKLVGVRYNPDTDIVKMSCEMLETQAQNKRYLGDIVDSLLKEAKDPTDTFKDVPLDTRHHKSKPKPVFPKEWVLTEERRAELSRYRLQMEMSDEQRELTGQLVDGIKQIEAGSARSIAAARELSPVVMATGGKGVKSKRLAVKR